MKKRSPASALSENLHRLSTLTGEPHTAQKIKLIQSIATIKTFPARTLSRLHDTLLFYLAYPENPEVLEAAKAAMIALVQRLEKNKTLQDRLQNSGILHTTLTLTYSLTMLRRLCTLFPGQIKPDSAGCSNQTLFETLKLLLPDTFHETLELKMLPLRPCLRALFGDDETNQLHQLLLLFENAPLPDAIRDQFFAQLQIYVSWNLNQPEASRSLLRGLPQPIHFHPQPPGKKVDFKALLDQPIEKSIPLSAQQKQTLIDTTRTILALLYREIDTSTYANVEDVELHDMGRGLRILLYGMQPTRRLPFESMIGYTLFKNGVPAGYGAGWVFDTSAKMALNIFEPMRGGESAWTYGQILRLYRQRFHVDRIVVEPYQFGKGNAEGLKSGAFWFYYRLGFRLMRGDLQTLAELEARKIALKKNYRSPIEMLKRFTVSNLELVINPKTEPYYEPELLARMAISKAKEKFSGNIARAQADAMRSLDKILALNVYNWSAAEKDRLRTIAPVVMLIDDLPEWPAAERRALATLLKSRGSLHEIDFIRQMEAHPHFRRVLQLIAKQEMQRN